MRVGVIGAGVIGVTTAYELAAAGHEVTVFERCGAAAAGTSFANAGVMAAGYVTPWAAPGMPGKVLRHLLSPHAPVRLRPGVIAQLPWLWRFWRACKPQNHAANRAAMLELARLSRRCQDTLVRQLAIDYERAQGFLVLLRTPRDVELARGGLKLLAELGVTFRLVGADRARAIEPGLNGATALHAAIHLPDDTVGNCRQFTLALKDEARKLGASFRFDCAVHGLAGGNPVQVDFARPDGERGGQQAFDQVVVCAGVDSKRLLQPLGVRLPLAPVYGYSVTAPLRHVDGEAGFAPRAALMDEKYKVAISRLGQRVRVAGSAELGSNAERLDERALGTLYRVLDDWFPGAAVWSRAQRWKGARPMLPDGPPIIGNCGVPGLWLNLGHGSSGFALACGSARVLAEMMAGRAPPLDVARFGLGRFRPHA